MSPFDAFGISDELERRLRSLGSGGGRLVEIAEAVRFSEGNPIIVERSPADRIFAISAGVARIFKQLPDGRRQITGFLFAGDFMGVHYNDQYGFGADAAVPLWALSFRRCDVERLIDEVPEIAHMFLANAFHELAAAQDRMLLLGRKTATERIASFLLAIDRRQRANYLRASDRIEIPVHAGDVADYLATTPETVSRTLAALRHDGVIRKTGSWRQIEILDRERLIELSGGASL